MRIGTHHKTNPNREPPPIPIEIEIEIPTLSIHDSSVVTPPTSPSLLTDHSSLITHH
jgi:hypothetical protein